MDWYDRNAMLEVIQAYGRSMRAEDDRARFYIVDGSFNRLVRSCAGIIPDWFNEALPESFMGR
jgi:Rad3-related DNA helicase